MIRTFFAPILALAIGACAATSVTAQQMGREGYAFPARNASMAAQFQFQSRSDANASSSAAQGALTQYVITSTSIGNLNEITQILSEGSSATIHQSTDQDSTGSQGSASQVSGDHSRNQAVAPAAIAP